MTACTCALCQHRVVTELERELAPVLRLHTVTERALARPSNVVPSHGYSIKVVS